MKDLVVVKKGESVVSTLMIAEGMNLEHRAVIKLVDKYEHILAEHGDLNIMFVPSGGRPTRYAWLNESHVMFLLAVMRNSSTSLTAVNLIIKNFDKMKNGLKSFMDALQDFDFDNANVRFVYAAIDGRGRVKIGISNDPERRVKELNIGNADDLTLVFTKEATGPGYSDETALHKAAGAYHVRSEWFSDKAMEVLK